ncbi:MAG: DEAD/DEAH box helicase [Candidatus Nanoarchaeia archaeon]
MKHYAIPPFKELLEHYPQIVEQLESQGFKKPTPIQHRAFEYALQKQDLLIQAPTGSGKTLIYALKILIEILFNNELINQSNNDKSEHHSPTHLIIAPNTVLVEQIFQMIMQVIPPQFSLNIITLKKKKVNIDEVDCLISTPKVLKEQLETFPQLLDNVQCLILDEADILLTKDFLTHLESIIEHLPENRQDLLFSATYTKEMNQVAKEYLHEPKVIELPSLVEKSQISQLIYIVENNEKLSLLYHTLQHLKFGLLLIFVNRREHIKQVEEVVKSCGFEFKSISSQKSEFERTRILQEFKEQKFDILIATDLISRGIDVPQISHIINYSIPQDHTKYVHRIGRATRHTNKGEVINFISKEDVEKFKQVLQSYKIDYKTKQTPQLQELPKSILKKIEGKVQHKKK